MERVDLSSPKEQPSIHRCEIAPTPTLLDRARILVSRDRTGRNIGYPLKQSSPYICKMQHTVLSVDGLKGSMAEFELGLLRQRARAAFEQKVSRGFTLWEVPVGFIRTEEGRIDKTPDRQVQQRSPPSSRSFINSEVHGKRPSGFAKSRSRCHTSKAALPARKSSGRYRAVEESFRC